MKKKTTYMYVVSAILLIVIGIMIWFATAPVIEKRGAIKEGVYNQGSPIMYLYDSIEERSNQTLVQYIYSNPNEWKMGRLSFSSEKDRGEFFLGAVIQAFALNPEKDQVVISVPYRHDVYEINVTRKQFEKFSDLSIKGMEPSNGDGRQEMTFKTLFEQNRQHEFFKEFGRIY